MTLKEKLVTLNIVLDNEYLNKYCELIVVNYTTKREKYKTQRHHIIPRCYFKKNNIDIDNSPSNIVVLSHKDHLLAHYYLSLCAKEDWFKYMNELSVRYCYNHIDEKDFINSLDEYQHLMEDVNKKMSNENRYKKWIYKDNKEMLVNSNELDNYLNCGWVVGRTLLMTDEIKEKIASKIRGTHHITTDETKRKIGEANKVALKGRKVPKSVIQKIVDKRTGKIWCNNGIKNKLVDNENSIPSGYVKGKILVNLSKEDFSKKIKSNRPKELYNTTGGTIVINNGKENKHINEDELDKYLECGWKKGKLPLGKLLWYNNGKINTRAYSCPNGFVEGRIGFIPKNKKQI